MTKPPELVYYLDDGPGISRRRCGRGYAYYAADGTHITDKSDIARLNAIGVPPAYQQVWLSPLANGHLQATGRDARARKQYRYHPLWQAQRAKSKFSQLVSLGENLPALRRWVTRHLSGDIGAQETAIAAVIALLDRGALRIGSPLYTDENGSHGATTLKPRHVRFDGESIRLDYVAKGGQRVCKKIRGAALQRVLERCQDLPGSTLITWLDEEGTSRAVRSEQVQAVLAQQCGAQITAKSLRTWNGSHAAFQRALDCTDDELTINALAEAAAQRLHNTPTIARQSYIHPQIIALAELTTSARQHRLNRACRQAISTPGYRAGEAELLAFLRLAAAG